MQPYCIMKLGTWLEITLEIMLYEYAEETAARCGRFIAHLFAWKLTMAHLTRTSSPSSKNVDNSTISTFVNISLRNLWPVNDQLCEMVQVFISGTASFMVKAAMSLKTFYPNLINVTCLVYVPHVVAKQIIQNYGEVNIIISCFRIFFLKAPRRVKCFK